MLLITIRDAKRRKDIKYQKYINNYAYIKLVNIVI